MRKIIIIFLLLIISLKLSAENTITIGYVPEMKPVTFTNSDGRPDGLAVELWTAIYDELGYEVKFVTAPFKEMYPRLLNHDLDAFATLIRTPEREEYIFYPEEPISTGWGQLFTIKGQHIEKIEQLRDKKIGFQSSDAKAKNFETLMQSIGISYIPVEFETNDKIITALKDGRIFAAVSNNVFVSNHPEIAPTPIIFSPISAYTATAITNDEIIRLMKQADMRLIELRADQSSYYWDIYKKWMTTTVITENHIPKWLIIVIAVLVLGIFLFIFISRLLRRQVAVQTAELQTALREKDVLIHEIHHRVKNNMAIISSILSLQEMQLEDEEERNILQSSRKRIDSMALVYEMFYAHPDFYTISFQKYIEGILNKLIYDYNPLAVIPEQIIDIEDINIKMDNMIPVGIIITEIISNAFQYAYKNISEPKLIIKGRQAENGKYELILRDNGTGIQNTSIAEASSIGFSLIKGLTEQLNGEFEILNEEGTTVKLSLRLT